MNPFPTSHSCPARLRTAARRLVAALCLALVASAQAAPSPTIPIPPGATHVDLGERLEVNGMPMNIRGFVTTHPPREVAQWFRRELGQPLVENTLDQALILGRQQGDHYLTVRLEAAGDGTRGLVAVSALTAARDTHAANRAATERWSARLPAGSQLITQVSANDRGRVARQVVFVNAHSPTLNAGRLTALLAADGFNIERETAADRPADHTVPTGGRVLYFRGTGKEAMATLFRDPSGKTVVVLDTVTRLEAIR